MGLSLTSDEVQKNLALIPAADNVSVCVSYMLIRVTSSALFKLFQGSSGFEHDLVKLLTFIFSVISIITAHSYGLVW